MDVASFAWRFFVLAVCLTALGGSMHAAAQERGASPRARSTRPVQDDVDPGEVDETLDESRRSQRGDVRPSGVRRASFEEPAPASEPVAEKNAPDTLPSSPAVLLSPRRDEPALPLAKPGGKQATRKSGGVSSLVTTLASLVLVLALFMGVAWLLRRGLPKSATDLPKEVVEVLGRAPLPGKQQMHLIRCGNKLLLVWSTAHGVETLTEITDPVEVDRLTSACREARPDSAAASFRQVFQQMAKEPVRGFLEPGLKATSVVGRASNSPHLEGDRA